MVFLARFGYYREFNCIYLGDKSMKKVGEFVAIGKAIGELVEAKNKSYGSAFQHSADLLKLFYPYGVRPEQYTDLLLIARICDKLFRIANKKDAFGESPYGDIIGYGILGKWNDDNDTDVAGVTVQVGGPDISPIEKAAEFLKTYQTVVDTVPEPSLR